MINLRVLAASAAVLSLTSAFVSKAAADNGAVNVYTYRETKLIQPLFDAFSKDTGIKVNVVSASSGLEQRMKAEGANSPADVLLTVDIGRIDEAVQAGVTQPIKSEVVDKVVPAQYRDPDGHWAGISMRARVIYASKDRVKQDKITYEELADPKWKGKICIRSGQHIYNNALFAAYTAKYGEAKAEEWLRGLKANLGRKPTGGDRDVARDILGGICDVGLANSYYVGQMKSAKPGSDARKWGDGIQVLKPTFAAKGAGTHVNISGAAVAKHAPNKAAAFAYLNAALDPAAQRGFADSMGYHPTITNAALQGDVAKRLALPEPPPKLIPAPYPQLSVVRDDMNDWWRRLLERP